MSYIKFDKEQLINLEYSLPKEVIRSNRAGSYSSTTLAGCNTRKYHGLLVCPIENFGNEKHVLLSALDETIIQNGAEFNLGIHRYRGGTYNPKGHKYIRDIVVEKIPKTTFRVGGAVLTKERILVENEEQVLVRYTLEEAQLPTTLRFKPFLAFRNIHHLSKANMFANTKYTTANNGISMRLYDGFPKLFMQFNKKVEYVHAPDWYYNVEYLKELNRGYDYLEDLLVPGYFEVTIKKGESIIFAAGTKETRPVSLKQRFTKELKKRSEQLDFMSSLKNAATQFVIRKKTSTNIIAGFPWYSCITRQALISLPGIAIALNDVSIFKKVLNTYSPFLKNGLFPENIYSENPQFNSADSSLWYIWAIQQYFKVHQKPKEIWRNYGHVIKAVFNSFIQSKSPGIHITKAGLIYVGKEKTALTWMNAYANGMPVTKREGMPVEINALWFNAICFALDIADMVGDEQFIEQWKGWVKKVGTAFNQTFWNEGHEHLADLVTQGVADWSVRPNMVIATALDYSPLTKEQQKMVLSVAKKKLLTKRGLRTLSPDHIRYKGVVEGGAAERESAMHNGAVWPWLIQFFVEGYLKIHKQGGLTFVTRIIEGFEEELAEHGIGTISETYNGNPPHRAKGAISQAWNVAGVIYATQLIEDYKN